MAATTPEATTLHRGQLAARSNFFADFFARLDHSTVINASDHSKLQNLAHRPASAYSVALKALPRERHVCYQDRQKGPALRGPSAFLGVMR